MGKKKTKTSDEQEEKWELPKRFRLTPESITASNEQQKKWAAELNVPFATASAQTKMRGRAVQIATDEGLSPMERAEAYAILGRFDMAANVGNDEALRNDYLNIAEAAIRDDDEWCNHPKSAQFVERDVYSVRHEADAHLLKCNTCGFRNLTPVLPEHIADGRRQRQESRRTAANMTPLQAKQLLGGRRG